MIKLIITDLDDTIVPESSQFPNPEYLQMIHKFRQKGILVVAASGRQKPSIKSTLKEVADELIYIADNGTDIWARDYEESTKFDLDSYRSVIADIKKLPDEYEIMACKPDVAYIEKGHDVYYDRMANTYGYCAEIADDAAELTDICKISVYNKDGFDKKIEKEMKERWGETMDVCLAGELFLDFMPKGCTKGSAVNTIQKHYGIKRDETVAFGNADNDITMLEQAKYSYAVANASEGLKSVASEIIGPVWEDAVLDKLKEIYQKL